MNSLTLVFTVFFLAMFSGFGAWLISNLYERKNRRPSRGALLGGLAGIVPVVLLIFAVVLFFSPALKPDNKAYYKTVQSSAQGKTGVEKELEDLSTMLRRKLIDEDEYKAKKAQILGLSGTKGAAEGV